jgi:hypothetical protein
VKAKIVSVKTMGNVAVVASVEEIHSPPPDTNKKLTAQQRLAAVAEATATAATSSSRRLFSITVLRNSNKQWRIWHRHTSKFSTSKFSGDNATIKSESSVSKIKPKLEIINQGKSHLVES